MPTFVNFLFGRFVAAKLDFFLKGLMCFYFTLLQSGLYNSSGKCTWVLLSDPYSHLKISSALHKGTLCAVCAWPLGRTPFLSDDLFPLMARLPALLLVWSPLWSSILNLEWYFPCVKHFKANVQREIKATVWADSPFLSSLCSAQNWEVGCLDQM